jgi:predicted ABC-type transport system involved in lysophospholipase L1 biosynthesis ATPase subunit
VLVTHDPAVGAQAQRMIRMRDGSIVADELASATAVDQ